MSTLNTVVSRARKFWKIAAGFPPDKEEVYKEHGTAQEFDRWGEVAQAARDQDTITPFTVLEYGCGGGSDTLSYLRRGCRVVAVDINPSNVATTSTRVREADGGRYNERYAVWLLEHSAKIQPIGGLIGEVDNGLRPPFDLASSHGVLHHIPQPLVAEVVKGIYDVLKPGAMFYAMLYTQHLLTTFAVEIDTLQRRHNIGEEEAFGWCTDGEGCPWAEAYSIGDGERLFGAAGFKVVSTFDYADGNFRTFRCQKPTRRASTKG